MSYTVLARKYRSQGFDDLVGQEPIAKTLKNAIKTNRVAHAYLFTGTRGVGKTTMARILAKALNCHNSDEPTTEPCCKCDSCIAINLGDDIDVVEIDGASNNGVEQVRELRQNAIYRPARSRHKIYIIDEVHMLTVAAFNALLKTLEEPPAHVKFIFATTEPNKVIATIQSRCQRFDFNNISTQKIAEHLESVLKQEKIKYDHDLVLYIAKMANGSMRDGLSLLDRLISTGEQKLGVELLEEYLGCPNSEKVGQLIGKIGDSEPAGALQAVDDLLNSGLSENQIVDSLIDYMRDIMVVKSAGSETELLILTSQQRKNVTQLAEKFDAAGLVYNITALEKLRWSVKNSETARALLEATVLRFTLSEHFLNIESLLEKLDTDPVKKKSITAKHIPVKTIEQTKEPQTTELTLPFSNDLDSIRDNWQQFLDLVSTRLSKGTAGLLGLAKVKKLVDNVLTISFGPSAESTKNMCEKNGRIQQIEALFKEYSGKNINLKLELEKVTEEEKQPILTSSKKRNKLVSDPAVKRVLMELGGTITGIEEI